ncbi:MAG: hypothetical protein JW782_04785 [Candidatus Saganbacteria bacterium]|nr:hypothetical protein [Candidatus Saganbacteria bacterium]
MLGILLLIGTAIAALISTHYTIAPQAATSGGSRSYSSNNSNLSSSGQASSAKMTSANYINISGFAGSLLSGTDSTPPSIGNFKVDGEPVVDNDYVKSDGLLTATILDLDSAISQESSSISIDGTATALSALVSPNSYDALSGTLTYQLNLSDGEHTMILSARDTSNNSASLTRIVKVDSSGAKAANAFIYPNPYNPSNGNARIAYQLNQDADITLYLFNEINQLVWKRTYPSGSNGGSSGYNEIEWNGTTDFGQVAGNGAYFLRIVSGGKQIGRIKIAILR